MVLQFQNLKYKRLRIYKHYLAGIANWIEKDVSKVYIGGCMFVFATIVTA
jgi:hypothetical protein